MSSKLSFKSVFDIMNVNYGEPEYEAEEILNEVSARRAPYQAGTPEKRRLTEDDENLETTTLLVELDELVGDRIIDSFHDPNKTYSVSTLSGIGLLDEDSEVTQEVSSLPSAGISEVPEDVLSLDVPAATEVSEDVRPLPVLRLDKGKKSSRKRKKDQGLKHPILNVCPITGKLRPAVELPDSSGCGETCKKTCRSKFSVSVRENIHKKYWEMEYNERSAWLAGQSTSRRPKCERIRGDNRVKGRSRASTYFFPKDGEDIEVYFISTCLC